MLKSGLVSVSFRGLAPEEVAKVAVASQLEGIEWGGDVHGRFRACKAGAGNHRAGGS